MECLKNRAAVRSRGFGLIEVILGIAVTMGLIVGGILVYTQASISMATQETTRLAHGLGASVQGLVQNIRASDRARVGLKSDDLLVGTGLPVIENSEFLQNREKAIRLPYGGELAISCVGPEFMLMDIIFPNNFMGNRLCQRLAFSNDEDDATGVLGGNFRVSKSACQLTSDQSGAFGAEFSAVFAQYFWDNPNGSELIGRGSFDGSTECGVAF